MGAIAHICNPSTPMARREVWRQDLESQSVCYTEQQTEQKPCLKAKDKG